jgi:hypothetical protein
MPPWTHIPRRRETRLSQFDAPVSPSPLPSVFENSPKVWAMICVDAPGFDRAGFHRRFNKEVTAFFSRELPAR